VGATHKLKPSPTHYPLRLSINILQPNPEHSNSGLLPESTPNRGDRWARSWECTGHNKHYRVWFLPVSTEIHIPSTRLIHILKAFIVWNLSFIIAGVSNNINFSHSNPKFVTWKGGAHVLYTMENMVDILKMLLDEVSNTRCPHALYNGKYSWHLENVPGQSLEYQGSQGLSQESHQVVHIGFLIQGEVHRPKMAGQCQSHLEV